MRYAIIFSILMLTSCGGKLSEEQRREMREEMKLQEIRRVTETEITEAAFAHGRSMMNVVNSFDGDSMRIDSMIIAGNGTIRFLVPGQADARVIEQQLIDAYLAAESGERMDNVQFMRGPEGTTDSILYSKPVLAAGPDGAEYLKGVWNIWLSRRELILSMDDE